MITELSRPQMLKEFESYNISRNQLNILKILYSQGPQPAHKIARKLGVSRAAVSQSVDVLVNLSLVSRRQSTSDRRSVSIAICKAGTAFIMHYDEVIRGHQLAAIINLSSEEQIQFNQLLEKYISSMISDQNNLDIVCLGCQESLNYDCIIQRTQGHCVHDPELEDVSLL